MKKKFMTFFLALSMVLLLVGCGKKEEETASTDDSATASVQEEVVKFVNGLMLQTQQTTPQNKP